MSGHLGAAEHPPPLPANSWGAARRPPQCSGCLHKAPSAAGVPKCHHPPQTHTAAPPVPGWIQRHCSITLACRDPPGRGQTHCPPRRGQTHCPPTYPGLHSQRRERRVCMEEERSGTERERGRTYLWSPVLHGAERREQLGESREGAQDGQSVVAPPWPCGVRDVWRHIGGGWATSRCVPGAKVGLCLWQWVPAHWQGRGTGRNGTGLRASKHRTHPQVPGARFPTGIGGRGDPTWRADPHNGGS